jgi:hypothetical protein
MTSRERVLSSLARKSYDRIPVKHEGTPEINQQLMDYFGLSNQEQLKRVIGDDFRYVEPSYVGRELAKYPDGGMEGFWGEIYKPQRYDGGEYMEAMHLPFAGVENVAALDRDRFPTADWFDYSTIKEQAERIGQEYAVCYGSAGDLDFMNGIARCRGTEQVLLDLAMDDPVYLELMEARFEFYYNTHERVLQAAEGQIDIIHVGEDLGTQRGPMISMDTFEKHFAPKFKEHFDMAHSYGSKTMMHMCGCVDKFLPRLVELGLDIYDVVQPTTPEMDIAELKRKHGDRLNFCGSMCVQSTLPFGTVADVEQEVQRRLELFADGGLFLGPTHAIQVNTPIDNILAMYRAAGSLLESIDESIRSLDSGSASRANLSKLF